MILNDLQVLFYIRLFLACLWLSSVSSSCKKFNVLSRCADVHLHLLEVRLLVKLDCRSREYILYQLYFKVKQCVKSFIVAKKIGKLCWTNPLPISIKIAKDLGESLWFCVVSVKAIPVVTSYLCVFLQARVTTSEGRGGSWETWPCWPERPTQ